MNSNVKTLIGVIFGAAVGGTAAYFITSKIVTDRTKAEHDEIIKYYDDILADQETIIKTLDEANATLSEGTIEPEKPSPADFYISYNKPPLVADDSEVEEEIEDEPEDIPHNDPKSPEVEYISDEAYGSKALYDCVDLTYYADGVLSDDWGEAVDKTRIGNALNHFGDFEDDISYVRNNALGIDYQITRDDRTYTEVHGSPVGSMEDYDESLGDFAD